MGGMKKDKKQMFWLAQNGCQKTREKLFIENMNLVKSILYRFGIKRDYEDVEQVGMMALLVAIDRFDVSLDNQFSTYAYSYIIGEVKKYFRDNKQTKIPRKIISHLCTIKRFQREYEKMTSKEPTVQQISDGTSIDERDIVQALQSEHVCLSLYLPTHVEGEKETTLLDSLKTEEDDIEKTEMRIALKGSLDVLNEKERELLYYRYIKEEKQRELAQRFSVSQVHISRMEKRALNKIKEALYQEVG